MQFERIGEKTSSADHGLRTESKQKKHKIVGSRLMSWTIPRRKHVERGTEKEFLPNDQKSVDNTTVEMLNRE